MLEKINEYAYAWNWHTKRKDLIAHDILHVHLIFRILKLRNFCRIYKVHALWSQAVWYFDVLPLLFSMLFHQLCMFSLIGTSMFSLIFFTKDAFSLEF